MGEILGYPCSGDFEKIDRDKDIVYIIDIVADISMNKYYLMTNVCITLDKYDEFIEIANRATEVLKRPQYLTILGGHPHYVKVNITTNVPNSYIRNKLIKNEELTKNEKSQINNMLYNFGFDEEFQNFFIEKYQYENHVHVGILIALLSIEKNDTLSPFYPLQQYPLENKKIYEIIKGWQIDLIDIINSTRNE
jgi:hypothetical protein